MSCQEYQHTVEQSRDLKSLKSQVSGIHLISHLKLLSRLSVLLIECGRVD